MNDLKIYFKDVGRYPVLKHVALIDLFKQLGEATAEKDKIRLRHKIMISNLRLVVSEAKKWVRPNIAMEDIIQEGNVGLMRAIDKFDWTKGFRFSTYARWWIQQAMRRYVTSTTRVVRLPAHILSALGKAHSICNEGSSMSNSGPSVEEIGSRLNMSNNLARATLAATKGTVSLNNELDQGNSGPGREMMQDRIASTELTPDEWFISREIAGMIRSVMAKLSDKEEKILRLRFGITEEATDHSKWPITQSEIEELKKQSGKK